MYLENLVIDAIEPQQLGRFWEAAVGGEQLTDGPGIYETRLAVEHGPILDLCFQQVADPSTDPPRLHVDLASGATQAEEVERLIGLGAQHLDIGQQDVPWVVLADPEGNPFDVMDEQTTSEGTGPIGALPLDSANPARDTEFWSWLTGWSDPDGGTRLRHPSGRGLVLALCQEPAPKTAAKNRLHLDVRLEAGDDAEAIAAGIVERGGARLDTDWGDLPWTSYTDPSGNEFCVLPARS